MWARGELVGEGPHTRLQAVSRVPLGDGGELCLPTNWQPQSTTFPCSARNVCFNNGALLLGAQKWARLEVPCKVGIPRLVRGAEGRSRQERGTEGRWPCKRAGGQAVSNSGYVSVGQGQKLCGGRNACGQGRGTEGGRNGVLNFETFHVPRSLSRTGHRLGEEKGAGRPGQRLSQELAEGREADWGAARRRRVGRARAFTAGWSEDGQSAQLGFWKDKKGTEGGRASVGGQQGRNKRIQPCAEFASL